MVFIRTLWPWIIIWGKKLWFPLCVDFQSLNQKPTTLYLVDSETNMSSTNPLATAGIVSDAA